MLPIPNKRLETYDKKSVLTVPRACKPFIHRGLVEDTFEIKASFWDGLFVTLGIHPNSTAELTHDSISLGKKFPALTLANAIAGFVFL